LGLSHLGALKVYFFVELSIQVNRKDDVENILPDLEIEHYCNVLDVYLELLDMPVKG
jgi:hypothetical protein